MGQHNVDLPIFFYILKYWGFITEVKSLSRVRLFATPWTVAYHGPQSMGFFRQECWSGLPDHVKYWASIIPFIIYSFYPFYHV